MEETALPQMDASQPPIFPPTLSADHVMDEEHEVRGFPQPPFRTPLSSHRSPANAQQNPGRAAVMNAIELNDAWSRVGIRIADTIERLFKKSKRTVVGDGTYAGFVNAVLENVPTASAVLQGDESSFGRPIYFQKGPSVSKRVGDIMPGDIITMENVKLRGVRGIKPYRQFVGERGPVVAIIREYRARKSVVKAYQACQQVGTQVHFLVDSTCTILMRPHRASSLSVTG